MAVHAKRWSYHRDPSHRRCFDQRLEQIARLQHMLRGWSPIDEDATERRNIVMAQLAPQRTALENTPSRKWLTPRVIEVRRRVA